MTKEVVKCGFGKRVFDVYEGTNAVIELKCSRRSCKAGFKCRKKTRICIGTFVDNGLEDFLVQRCPVCNHRVFDAMRGSYGIIETKCPRCRKIVNIFIGDVDSAVMAA